MAKKSSNVSKGHAGDSRNVKRTHGAAGGNRKSVSGTHGSVSGDIVQLDMSILDLYDYLVFDFPCYPLDIVDFQGHYFLPVEAVTCQS